MHSPLQAWSLAAWEAVDAVLHRRRPGALYHSALKIGLGPGEIYTLELTPAFKSDPVPPLMTGPVGIRGADRFRIFRYQMRCLRTQSLPDEAWAVAGPIRLTQDCGLARRVLDLAPSVPGHVWGLRAPGTSEMWTSDSVISWLLVRAGIDAAALEVPPRGRAPGWAAGFDAARC